MDEDVVVLKQTAAVMEGLCKKVQEEPEYDEMRFIAQTLLEYCRSFDKAYLKMLARESGRNAARAWVSGSLSTRSGGDGEPEPAYFSTSC